jgi:hypothetical protein
VKTRPVESIIALVSFVGLKERIYLCKASLMEGVHEHPNQSFAARGEQLEVSMFYEEVTALRHI